MARYGMVIDLKRCIGCNACVVACKSEHNTPGGIFQTAVLEQELGKFPDTNRIFLPVLCNHCALPTCAEVCPTQATYQRSDGVVMIDYEKCIGCCACIEHCPYHVRTLVRDRRTLYADGVTVFEKPVHQKILNKVVTKCDFCYHRMEAGLQPSCCEVCPTAARVFGDISDDNANVSQLIKKYNGWQMLPEKGTDPCVYYVG